MRTYSPAMHAKDIATVADQLEVAQVDVISIGTGPTSLYDVGVHTRSYSDLLKLADGFDLSLAVMDRSGNAVSDGAIGGLRVHAYAGQPTVAEAIEAVLS